MSTENRNTASASNDDEKKKVDGHFAESIAENDPHKVEKLATAGKDEDAAEASE